MLWFIVLLLIMGLIVGAIARFLVPGPDPMGVGGTTALGVIGSFIGGFLGYLLFGRDVHDGAVQASGFIGSVIGAVIALMIYRAATHRRPLGHN